MRGTDIPQANSLDRVRDVVRAVQDGAQTPTAIERVTLLSARHAAYYLQAARILGLLRHQRDKWVVSDSGHRLLATTSQSEAESMLLRQVIRSSDVITKLAPDLLDEENAPTLEKLTVSIMESAALSLATARRRAMTLMAWRERVLSPAQATLFDDDGPGSPRVEQPTARQTEGVRVSAITIQSYGPIRELSKPLRPK